MRIVIFCLAILFTGRTWAGDKPITVDDYFTLAQITQVAISPDGKQVAYVEARWAENDESRKTDLWVIDTDGKDKPSKLTVDRANDRNPKWFKEHIYFLGNRKKADAKDGPFNGKTQIWRVPVAGGDVEAVTKLEGGVVGYDLDRKSGTIIYQLDKTVQDADDFAKLRAQFGKVEYGHGSRKVSELYRLKLEDNSIEKFVDASRYIREFSVAAGGKRIAMITAKDDSVIRSEGESKVDIWESGTITTPPTSCYRAKAASPHAWLEDLAWNADGSKFAFCAIFDGHPAEIIIGEKASEWTTHVSPRPEGVHVRGYGSPLKWHPNGLPMMVAEANGRSIISPLDDSAMKLVANAATTQDRVTYTFDFDEAGQTGVMVMGTSKEMGELYVNEWKAGGATKKLFDLNPHIANWAMPTIQHVTWKGKDGSTVGGVLELPAKYDGKTPLPLVVAIHGGPTTSTKAGLEYDPHNGRLYFAAHGYAVLLPNYRGSTGYGDKFVTDLLGQENDVDVSDIVLGVQSLIEKKIADPNRIASMGWSNGGYLTNCLITQKTLPFKLKAASSGAGIVDTVLEWGSNDEPAYPKVFKKGHPWEKPETYRKTSPTYGLGNVITPTLIHVGGEDVRCPPANSRMLYRALKEFVNVPTELVVYPGEPHGLTKKSNRKAKMEWDLAWFAKYLKSDPVYSTVESSLKTSKGQIRQFAFDGNPDTMFVSDGKPGADDHFTVTFDKPVMLKSLTATTGRAKGEDALTAGVLQVSTDGKTFVDVAKFAAGTATAGPKNDIKAVRIVPGADATGPLVVREFAIDSEPPVASFQYPVEFVLDYADAPEMKEWAEKVAKVCEKEYRMINEELKSDDYKPATVIYMALKSDYKGVAQAAGNRITGSVKFFKDHPEDIGAYVHETTHVVQRYRGRGNPGWLVEGIADYVRYYKYEPGKNRRISERAKYDGSYGISAAFLNSVAEKYDKELVRKLNKAMRDGVYREELWKQYTGKPLKELGEEWQASLKK